MASQLDIPFAIFASIDDSLGKKGKATKHLEAVDYQHNHTESTRKKQAYTNGYIFVELHLQIGPFGFLFDARPYLRDLLEGSFHRIAPVYYFGGTGLSLITWDGCYPVIRFFSIPA